MISSRLGRIALVLLLFVTNMGLSSTATSAQEDAPFPPDPLPSSATLNYVVDGEIDAELAGSGRLVFERFELEVGDTLPEETGPQILINVAGALETVDDLGLTASLKAGDRLFAPAGTINELTAKEKSTILRARLVGLSVNVDAPASASFTINEGHCSPNTVSVPSGSVIEVINETDRVQPFSIASLDIQIEVEPNSTTKFALTGAKTGSSSANCGQRTGSGAPISSPMIKVTEADPLPTLPATTSEFDGQAILIDAQLAPEDMLTTTLYVAKVTLQGKSNTGEQSFDGVTGVVATSQPLSLIRSGRLPATLPVQTGVALPAGTEITIENTAVGPTEFFAVGLTDESPTDVSADTDVIEGSDDEDNGRPTSRDDSGPADKPDPTPNSDTVDAGSLESMLPGDDDLEDLGYTWANTEPLLTFDDSLYESLDDASVRSAWEEGIIATYITTGMGQLLVISIDRFSSISAAADTLGVFRLGMVFSGGLAPTPRSQNADDVIATQVDSPEDDMTTALIVSRFGDILITVVVGVDLYDDALAPALEVWELVDAAQS